ncbi:hypothetical protein CLM83_15140 [Streptomyces albidoflavus]|uniref:hypothetical protein n=1 Tax=Streptomyces albidoflavus TaxID=1886 RepID=UPI000BB5E746|nr:hypothetical protein [Streptomyces albidoflavus]PBO17949.1 hypothetical protein CLM83_15140 [Streptomyces albidoflavus]
MRGGVREGLDGRGTARGSECLGAGGRDRVSVGQRAAEGRGAGGRRAWVGLVNDPGAVADITAWVENGGPGLTDAPDIRDLYTFRPSRRVQAELHDA